MTPPHKQANIMLHRIYDVMLERYAAEEIAKCNGTTIEDAACQYFREVASCEEPDHEDRTRLPQYCRYVDKVPHTNFDLYYEWYCEYYFIVKTTHDFAFSN